jgi:chemotaxis protein MotD
VASVTPVQTSELRPNSPSQQAPKSGDPFAMLLDHVSAKRATAPEPRRRPEAPDTPRVNSTERPERPQLKQAAKLAADNDKPAAPATKEKAAAEDCSATENKTETQDADTAQQPDVAAAVDAEAATEETVILAVNAEGSPDASTGEDETANEDTVIEADDTVSQPDISVDANVVVHAEGQAQQPVQQAAPDAGVVPAPVAAAESAVEVMAEGEIAAVAPKTETAPAAQTNNQSTVPADAEAPVTGEEAPQNAPQARKPEETAQTQRPVASNHAEVRDAAIAEKGEQAAQSSNSGKPEVPAQAKEHASAKPLEHVPAQSNVENSAPRQQQLTPQGTPVMPEPVRALAGSINPVNLRPANDGPSNAVQLNAQAIGVEIASRAKEGLRRFDIRLDPPELGRIDVRLEVDNHGKASTRLIVERPETLDLLQRDARNLERALQSAGLNTDDGGLEFSLRDQSQNGLADAHTNSGYDRRDDFLAAAIEDAEPASPALERYARSVLARGGVDIRI